MQSLIACNPDCMHAISGICELLQTSKFGFSVNRISKLQVWHAISGLWQTLSLVAVSSRLASSVAVCLHRDGKYATLQFGPIQYESPIACNPKCIQGRIGTSAQADREPAGGEDGRRGGWQVPQPGRDRGARWTRAARSTCFPMPYR